MPRTRRFTGLSFLLALTVCPESNLASDPPKPKADQKVEFVGRHYRQGIVTELTEDSITIHCEELRVRAIVHEPGGKFRWEDQIIPAKKEPKKFSLAKPLIAGIIPKEPRPQSRPLARQPMRTYHVGDSYMYRLSDVKIGDEIRIIYSRVDGIDTCDHISINKRPGGRIPPLPDGVERPDLDIHYHEWMNAYWDLEDKGIPYPEKFGPMRRWPIAPMPRKLTLDGPIISK